MGPFFSGILTGIFLQLAIGPVFFYVLGITVDSNYANSLSAILGVTLADYFYIILSLIGVGRILQQDKIKKVFGVASSVMLILFGAMILYKGLSLSGVDQPVKAFVWTPVKSFVSCFVLTISSPLTIVFWTSIFTTKAIEKNYMKRQLVVFGFGTGFSTFLFLGLTMAGIILLKANIPAMFILGMNCTVGVLLMYYGITRSVNFLRGPVKEGALA